MTDAGELHDPTPSATIHPAHPPKGTRLSRNEVEGLCLKAARGSGMAWGLAEEAGFSAGWLAARGIDGPAALLALLTARRPGPDAITVADRMWTAADGGMLCPLAAGAALDDHADLADGVRGGPVTLDRLEGAILAVPLLVRMGRALDLTWDAGRAWISARGEVARADLDLLARAGAVRLRVALPDEAGPIIPEPATPDLVPLSARTLAGLHALSMRTTVPASEQSRRGAGATAGDND